MTTMIEMLFCLFPLLSFNLGCLDVVLFRDIRIPERRRDGATEGRSDGGTERRRDGATDRHDEL